MYYREIGVGVFGLGDCIIGIYSCEECKVLVQLYRLDVWLKSASPSKHAIQTDQSQLIDVWRCQFKMTGSKD